MTDIERLKDICAKTQDRSMHSPVHAVHRPLIIGRTVGTLSIPEDSERGWVNVFVNSPVKETEWTLQPPLDELLRVWRASHPDEFSSAKLALYRFGRSVSSRDALELNFRPTSWSQVRAFHEAVENRTSPQLTDPLMSYHLSFGNCPVPNIAVVHAIVETNDGQLLMTKRSEAVHYHPGAWSVSLEEGLAEKDFRAGANPIAEATQRGIEEEITGEAQITLSDFSILAVAIEYPILNPAFVVFAKLNLDATAVMQVWQTEFAEQINPEATALRFVPYTLVELERLFRASTEGVPRPGSQVTTFHPTSAYRIVVAMIRRFGLRQTVDALV